MGNLNWCNWDSHYVMAWDSHSPNAICSLNLWIINATFWNNNNVELFAFSHANSSTSCRITHHVHTTLQGKPLNFFNYCGKNKQTFGPLKWSTLLYLKNDCASSHIHSCSQCRAVFMNGNVKTEDFRSMSSEQSSLNCSGSIICLSDWIQGC